MPPKAVRAQTSKEKAYKRKEKLLSAAKAVLKVDPEAVKRRLESASQQGKLDVHHEVLKETQDEVEDHFGFITNLQALNQALRERDHKRERAQDSVMNMFTAKCLSTVHAWLLAQFFFKLIERILLLIDPSWSEDQDLLNLVGYSIYACLLAIFVPPLQYKLSHDDEGELYSRKHAFVGLQVKALPMILAWAFKDVVQYFLAYTDPTQSNVWNEIVTTLTLVLIVTALHNLPAVDRAGRELAAAEPNNSIKNRYLTLPSAMFLGTGYAFNDAVTYLVDKLTEAADSRSASTPSAGGQSAGTIFKVMFQVTYFGMMAFAVIRFDACFTQRRVQLEKKEEELEAEEDYVAAFELDVANDIGDTITHAAAFVYGWGFSDTLRVVYFPFFNGCPTSSWKSCTQDPVYPLMWYYAILCTLILGTYMKQLSMQEYRSSNSKSFRTLMITAMGLTVGWGWMDVCAATTSFFISQWRQTHDSEWSEPIIYLVLLVFVYIILVEIYFQILDEMRFLRRERKEFQETYPTIPMKSHGNHVDLEQAAAPTSAPTEAPPDAEEKKDVKI